MTISKIPPGITPDNQGMWGLFGLMSNINNYAESISAVTTAGTNTTITAAQLLAGFVQLNAGASGGYTVTLPSTVSIIAALGPTIPTDGTFSMPIHMINNGVGQTMTGITVGDASTSVSGTNSINNNTVRKFLLNVASPSTVTITNVGGWTL